MNHLPVRLMGPVPKSPDEVEPVGYFLKVSLGRAVTGSVGKVEPSCEEHKPSCAEASTSRKKRNAANGP